MLSNRFFNATGRVKRTVVFLCFAILLCLGGGFPIWLDRMQQCPSGISTDSQAHDIVTANIDYEHLWDYQTTFIRSGALDLIDDLVVFANGDCHQVVALNLATGKTAWTSTQIESARITADVIHGQIYVELGNDVLVALDKNGNQIWKNTSLQGQRGGIIPYILSNGSLVAFAQVQFVSVNPSTGEFGDVIPVPDHSFVIGDEYFWGVRNGQLIASDFQFANIVWHSEYQGLTQCCLKQVVVTSEHIVLLFAGKVIVLDRETGALNWETSEDQIVTNFVLIDGQVVFLNIDATLFFMAESSGETLASVKFKPPAPNARDIVNGIGRSMLVAADDIIVIYFGDTDMLSAYHFHIEDFSSG